MDDVPMQPSSPDQRAHIDHVIHPNAAHTKPATQTPTATSPGHAHGPCSPETAALMGAYLPALELLDRYDRGDMPVPEGSDDVWRLTRDEALSVIRSLPFYGESDLFGRERDGLFAGIVDGLYQSFADVELYPSVQRKAANLLYLVVKDHPFLDGNKRSAAALFVYFLERNGLLRQNGSERPLVANNALAAITLMVALSDPTEKETMVALVENLLVLDS